MLVGDWPIAEFRVDAAPARSIRPNKLVKESR